MYWEGVLRGFSPSVCPLAGYREKPPSPIHSTWDHAGRRLRLTASRGAPKWVEVPL